jgi:hypothetical protein
VSPHEKDGPEEEGRGADAAVSLARRRLLKIGIYTAPAIVGTLLLQRDAEAQSPTCDPYQCKPAPCPPKPCDPTPCNPTPCKPAPCGPGPCKPSP